MPRHNNRRKNSNVAVALKYNPEKDYTPVIVASGHGKVAERIISLADDNGVPIYRDDSTAAVLTMLSVGQGIPPELYKAVAEIYVQVLALAKEETP